VKISLEGIKIKIGEIKMKIKIISAIAFLLLLGNIGFAETNVTTWIYSDQDVNFWANIDSEHSDLYINGIDWNNGNMTVMDNTQNTYVQGGSFSVWDMTQHIEETIKCMMGTKKFCSEWNFRIGNALNSWFLPRIEFKPIHDNFNIRLVALEKTMEATNSEAYCQGKIDTMIEYNLTWVSCREQKFYNLNNKGISVMGVEK